MLTPKKFLLIRSMQVKDNHFYRKLSVMLIYNKSDDVIRYDVIIYHVILIDKNYKMIFLPLGAKNEGEETNLGIIRVFSGL